MNISPTTVVECVEWSIVQLVQLDRTHIEISSLMSLAEVGTLLSCIAGGVA